MTTAPEDKPSACSINGPRVLDDKKENKQNRKEEEETKDGTS